MAYTCCLRSGIWSSIASYVLPRSPRIGCEASALRCLGCGVAGVGFDIQGSGFGVWPRVYLDLSTRDHNIQIICVEPTAVATLEA